MKLFKRLSREMLRGGTKQPLGKPGCRAYAVGDIHGRLDLLELALARIEEDNASRGPARTFVIFLGDLIDRGPDSAGVVERLRTYAPDFAKPILLAGNHEEVFLRILAGEAGILSSWLRFGGAECAQSYGVDPELLKQTSEAAAIERLRRHVPREHRRFLEGFGDTFRFGDYLFVHAGIRPGIPLVDQETSDLRWIRDPFLSDAQEHGFVVVHGHTIVEDVEERANRIGLDTGAYRTGRLTTLGIEADARWLLPVSADGTELAAVQSLRAS